MSEVKKLLRSRNQRMIAGVCAGLGEFFGVDPTVVRLVFVAATLFGFPQVTIPTYLILMIVVPEDPAGGAYIPPAPPAVYEAESREPTDTEIL